MRREVRSSFQARLSSESLTCAQLTEPMIFRLLKMVGRTVLVMSEWSGLFGS